MIQTNNIQKNNIFSLFPQYDLDQAVYAIKEPKILTDESKDTVEISTKKNTNKKKKIIFGSTLASTIATAGVLGIIFAKGIHGGSYNKLSKISDKLAEGIQEAGGKSHGDLAHKTVYYARKGANKTTNGLKSVSNFTAIKDWFCDKLFRTNKVTTKFADGSKNGFKKVVDNELGKKYNVVEYKVKDLSSLLKHYDIKNLSQLDESQKLQKVTIKGVTKTLGEWIEALSVQTKTFETAYDEGFSIGARKFRDQKRTGLLSGIKDKIRDRFFKNKGLLRPENYKTYATEDVSRAARIELGNDIMAAKKKVSNNIPAITTELKGNLSLFSKSVKPADKKSMEAVKLLKQEIENFKSCTGEKEVEARKQISEKVISIINDTIASIKSCGNYSAGEQTELIKQLDGIKTTVLSSTNGNSKGALEEIMTILKGLNQQELGTSGKKIITDNAYKKYSKLAAKISKGLNKATTSECGEYFLKQAELEVGSAPTDILSVLLPVGASAYAIGKADKKEDRISAVLTTCIPLVGTFATFVYGTTRMFSGAKNLMFSAVSGLVLSKIGSYCNKLYKNYRETGSVRKVAKNEYDNFMTDITPKEIKEAKSKSKSKTKNKTKAE